MKGDAAMNRARSVRMPAARRRGAQCAKEDAVSQPTPGVGDIVAVTRDVPEASVRSGEAGTVLAAGGRLVRLCMDGDAQEVQVPWDAVRRVAPVADDAPAPAAGDAERQRKRKGGWFEFSWSRVLSLIVLATVLGILPAYRMLKETERRLSPPPPKQKVQQVPIRVRERSPGQIERPPLPGQPPETAP